ncbi:MAG: efflux RND transporter periplasmic adaptor subunit [Nitrospiraceae bacterium]|nr:MAG: efflux RND transporter periplasmic adaptor subunit [Nitrospiraceae bacterium]
MKKSYLVIIAGVILAIGISVYFLKPWSGQKTRQSSSITSPVKAGSAGHDHDTGSETAQTKESGEQREEEEAPTVEIPGDKQQMIGVKTVEVVVKPLRHIIRTVGRIEYDEKSLATVNTKIEGWIERLYIDYTGKYVKKGDPLADIYSPELLATQQEYLNALKWAGTKQEVQIKDMQKMLSRDAEKILEAARQRLRLWDISESQIKKIEESGKPARTLTIYSPVNGYVVQKMALQGMRVMPGEKLFDIADLSQVWIIADIYEYELPMIKIGQPAVISLSNFPGKEFASRIDYVYPTMSAETRTAKIRFTIPNPGGQLKPQMFTNVEVKVDLGKRLAIPDDAVIDTGTRQIVYVDTGDESFEPREVRLGIRAEGLREVLSGLKAGERVVSSAAFLVDSEAQLKGVVTPGGHKH